MVGASKLNRLLPQLMDIPEHAMQIRFAGLTRFN
jgi:hypothetical protein